MKTLFLAWQDPKSRNWLPVGRLSFDGRLYQFVYTHGAETAESEYGFEPLANFPKLNETYESTELFPLFSNRVPPSTREDYNDFIQWLNISKNEDDPIAILARSGGRRATDNLEVFPSPQPDESGSYHIHFFAHGIRHLSLESIARIEGLKGGEELLLALDFQNHADQRALMLRTNDTFPGDRYVVGYCPAYLLDDALQLLQGCMGAARVQVERVNPPPAPMQLRLLCNLSACWPSEFKPFSSELYQPIPSENQEETFEKGSGFISLK